MAEIPIQRKEGTNWLLWLGLLALLALLAWWFLGRSDDAAEPALADSAAVPAAMDQPVAPTDAAPLTDVAAIVTAADPMALVGQRVHLASAQVQEVVSDRGFWVGPSAEQRLFAVRMAQDSPATPADGAVNAGQTLSMSGIVRAMPADLEQQRTPWNLGSTDVSVLQAQRVYVEVDSLAIVQRP